jgi:hypothetical protein
MTYHMTYHMIPSALGSKEEDGDDEMAEVDEAGEGDEEDEEGNADPETD